MRSENNIFSKTTYTYAHSNRLINIQHHTGITEEEKEKASVTPPPTFSKTT
jgi:hypothetical protein